MSFLNETGLAHFWSKLKALLANKSDIGHTHSNYASTVTTTGSGNAITSISQSGNTITATKDSSFASSSHTHTPSNISLSGYTSGGLDPMATNLVGSAASNKSFGLPASAIVVEYSNDGGSTWTSYDSDSRNLFNESRASAYYLGNKTSAGTQTTNSMLRVTIEPTDRYCYFQSVYHWMSTNGNTVVFDLQRSTIGAKNTFTTILTNQPLSGWSGNNIHYFSGGTFGGGSNQTSNTYKYRLIYKMTKVTSSYGAANIQDIRFFGVNVWGVPSSTSGTVGNMVQYNAPYQVDANNKKVTFPETVQATTFSGALSGNATTATTATKLGTTTKGSATQPIYLNAGVPTETTYTLGTSVPSDAVFTDTNTWRGIQNNLTSDSTTESLSAAQGKALKSLVDGKAPASHTHDYLPLSGGTLTGNLSGKYLTGTWLQTTAASDLGNTPQRIAVLDGSGWVYYRTLAEIKQDLGITALEQALANKQDKIESWADLKG